MTEELTPGKRLYLSLQKVRESEVKVQMAQQTLQGALGEMNDRRSRFNGQIEFVAGGLCSWKADEEKQEVSVELLPEELKSEEAATILELPREGADSVTAGPELEADAADGAVEVPSPS